MSIATTAPTMPLAPDQAARTAGPVLVATDGEDGARALVAAQQLAARSGRDLVVLSVVEPPQPGLVGLDGGAAWIPDAEVFVRARRERVMRQLHAVLGDEQPLTLEVVVDEPSAAIARAADERHAALIVMGLGRHDVRARLVGGEMTLRAMRRARVPVLAIGRDPLRVPPRVAVVGVDFSGSCLEAARVALDLLADGGTLHLVHVWARFPIEYPELEKRDAAYERSLPGRFAQLEAALLDRARDVTILSSSLLGEPAEQVTAFAQSHNADIVAAGRQGHRLFERLLLGRVTTGLVRGAPCAVLVTPEPSGLEREALQRALTGTGESRAPEEWAALLTAFTQRNRSRRTTLEVDDPAFGAQSQESGYTLLGAVYDHKDRRVELMLGLPGAAEMHVTRMIPDVRSLAVHAARDGRDTALRVEHGAGQTLLTFLPARR